MILVQVPSRNKRQRARYHGGKYDQKKLGNHVTPAVAQSVIA